MATTKKTCTATMPKLGVISTSNNKPGPGSVEEPQSWAYPIEVKVVEVSAEALENGDPAATEKVEKALTELCEDCAAVTSADAGLLRYTHLAGAKAQAFFSPLLQLPTMLCGFGADDKILVVTDKTEAQMKATASDYKDKTGIDVLRGAQTLVVLTLSSAEGVVEKVLAALEADAAIRAVLLESPALASKADDLRCASADNVAVFDAFTGADLFMQGYLDNPRFGENFQTWKNGTADTQDAVAATTAEDAATLNAAKTSGEQVLQKRGGHPKKRDVSLGVVRLDYDYEAAIGDIDHPGSYDHHVYYRAVHNLTFDVCKAGPHEDSWTPHLQEKYLAAIDWLITEKNVNAIAADCGFYMWFQKLAREHVKGLPVCMSSLSMLPSLVISIDPSAKIAVFTADSGQLKPMTSLIEEECGLSLNDDRLVFVGCQHVDFFGEAVAKGDKVDVPKATPHIVQKALDTQKENPNLRAFLFECTELPPYSDAVREATGLPVYDAITGTQFFLSGYEDNPRVGKDGWMKSFDNVQQKYDIKKDLLSSSSSVSNA